MGVEWGSSWPAAASTDRGTTDGVTTDGGTIDRVNTGSFTTDSGATNRGTVDSVTTDGVTTGTGATDEGSAGGHCYGLYYTVPDDLRRPWQVRSTIERKFSIG